ncbi:MAG: YraN family protein [Candidatus Doudnabacteria bacterium]|nr:YraN family protein [Candidatus Doudnabacteria bacterium]
MTSNLGRAGEELTARHYEAQGYTLVAKNFRPPFGKQTGELDLIESKEKELVFVEVKTRSGTKFGTPFDSVDKSKQKKLVTTAKIFLKLNPKFKDYNIRFDVAAVDIDNWQEPVIILMNAIEDLD